MGGVRTEVGEFPWQVRMVVVIEMMMMMMMMMMMVMIEMMIMRITKGWS